MKQMRIILLVIATASTSLIEAQGPMSQINTIFTPEIRIEGGNFTGTAWVTRLFPADNNLNSAIGNVVFEPGARSNWHRHPAGQILIALNGVGYYQERGKELRILRPGETAKCPPDVEHWHGASHEDWFVQLAITNEHPNGRVIWLDPVTDAVYGTGLDILKKKETLTSLSDRHQYFVVIASYTAMGEHTKLKTALQQALDGGITVNEIKEVLVHLYAYCGFPKSIQGLRTLLAVVEERQEQGIEVVMGKSASEIDESLPKYERGKKVLETLTGQPQTKAKTGYRAFSPEIDVFLKEHLFADIFERDVLSYQDREITTISVLLNLGNVEPMIFGHMRIALNIGIRQAEIKELLDVIENAVGKNKAEVGRKVFTEVQDALKVQE